MNILEAATGSTIYKEFGLQKLWIICSPILSQSKLFLDLIYNETYVCASRQPLKVCTGEGGHLKE